MCNFKWDKKIQHSQYQSCNIYIRIKYSHINLQLKRFMQEFSRKSEFIVQYYHYKYDKYLSILLSFFQCKDFKLLKD